MNRKPCTPFALLAAAFLASSPAMAQHQGHDMSSMPGMAMPAPAPAAKQTPKAKPKPKKQDATKPAAKQPPQQAATPAPEPPVDHSAMGHSTMDHAGMDMSGMNPSTTDSATMDHSTMDHSGMDHSGMDHSGMDMPAGDLPADAAPHEPLPALTDADRTAAFPPVGAGHAAHDARSHSYFLIDRLEVNDQGGGAWEGLAWMGGDINRAWLRTEGEADDGRVERGNVELLYGHAVGPWWDLVAGAKHEFGEGPSRTYAAVGVQGLTPYKFEFEATLYAGNGGRTAATLEGEYDTLITNRWILQWQAEANLHGRADANIGVGAGLSTIEVGARLRYEITRQIAPYVGIEVEHAFGGTADLRRDAGVPVNDTRLVAGLRIWF